MRLSAVEQMMKEYPNVHNEKIRNHLGSFGILQTFFPVLWAIVSY
jgi:hypothetical protein